MKGKKRRTDYGKVQFSLFSFISPADRAVQEWRPEDKAQAFWLLLLLVRLPLVAGAAKWETKLVAESKGETFGLGRAMQVVAGSGGSYIFHKQ